MRSHLIPTLAFLILSGVLAAIPAGAASPAPPASQTVVIADTRSGDGPCGFTVERTVEGTVAIAPRLDAEGTLDLVIEPIILHGMLTNPDNGKSVELKWVRPDGQVGFGNDGRVTTVTWLLDGFIFRGYDSARTNLTLALPADGADRVAFAPGVRSTDPWAHVCGLLA